MSDARITFTVPRPCNFGECPATVGGACDCGASRGVEVEVDELTDVERGHFLAHGTDAQRSEIHAWEDAEDGADEPEGLDMDGAMAEAA